VGAGNWDEFRTALHVARLGTVSGAADKLGVHHATVIRHIDALEGRLGVKLFQRHARGYTATEAGQDLLKTALATDEQLNHLVGRIRGRSSEVSGELVITTVSGFSTILTPVLARFQAEHRDLKIKYLSASRLFRLEYGEAHIAIRAGPEPKEADNVVHHLARISPRLCAAATYVEQFGKPKGIAEFSGHRFVAPADFTTNAPHEKWAQENFPAENIVFRASERLAQETAVRQGVGIGFVTNMVSASELELEIVMDCCTAWQSDLWLVSHVDLHRTGKVQAIWKALKAEARLWQGA